MAEKIVILKIKSEVLKNTTSFFFLTWYFLLKLTISVINKNYEKTEVVISKKNKYILYKNLPKRPILDKYFLFLFPFPKQEPGDIFSTALRNTSQTG